MIGLGAGMTALGGTLTKGVTLPLIGIGTAAVKVASDFEAAMSNVQAISSSSAEDMRLLSEKAKEMGSTTKFSAKILWHTIKKLIDKIREQNR